MTKIVTKLKNGVKLAPDIFESKTGGAGFHNSFFRGKNITNYFDDETLWTRISSGTFDDLFVGDYIQKDNIIWRIAGFDIYYGKGDTPLNKHHAVIVPDTNIATGRMNDTNSTIAGVIGSEMYTTTLQTILDEKVTPIFGDHVLEHATKLTSAANTNGYNHLGTATGASTATLWKKVKLNLMNEVELCGSLMWSSSGFDVDDSHFQFPLFHLTNDFFCKRDTWYWLRGIANKERYIYCNGQGCLNTRFASDSGGIRPYFYID